MVYSMRNDARSWNIHRVIHCSSSLEMVGCWMISATCLSHASNMSRSCRNRRDWMRVMPFLMKRAEWPSRRSSKHKAVSAMNLCRGETVRGASACIELEIQECISCPGTTPGIKYGRYRILVRISSMPMLHCKFLSFFRNMIFCPTARMEHQGHRPDVPTPLR